MCVARLRGGIFTVIKKKVTKKKIKTNKKGRVEFGGGENLNKNLAYSLVPRVRGRSVSEGRAPVKF